jgi:hypothetical protein
MSIVEYSTVLDRPFVLMDRKTRNILVRAKDIRRMYGELRCERLLDLKRIVTLVRTPVVENHAVHLLLLPYSIYLQSDELFLFRKSRRAQSFLSNSILLEKMGLVRPYTTYTDGNAKMPIMAHGSWLSKLSVMSS